MFGIPVDQLTLGGLLGIAILMILTGMLVPRTTYREKAEESERWRTAFETSEEARRLSDGQTAELLEMARATQAVLVALFRNTESERLKEEGRNVARS